MKPEKFAALQPKCDGDKVFAWGAKLERIAQFEMMVSNCVVLFRSGSLVPRYGVVVEWDVSPELGVHLLILQMQAKITQALVDDLEKQGLDYFVWDDKVAASASR